MRRRGLLAGLLVVSRKILAAVAPHVVYGIDFFSYVLLVEGVGYGIDFFFGMRA
jgi:hypothetical protein